METWSSEHFVDVPGHKSKKGDVFILLKVGLQNTMLTKQNKGVLELLMTSLNLQRSRTEPTKVVN